jgi:hypothetical protein
MSQSDPEDDFALVSRALGGLPIINHVLDRLGLPALLAGVLPAEDARVKLAPAAGRLGVFASLPLSFVVRDRTLRSVLSVGPARVDRQSCVSHG